MSDTRFTLLGIGLIFAGFIILGIFGSQYFNATVEAEQFGNCFDYSEDNTPVPVDCDVKLQQKSVFFILGLGLVGVGIFALIKGVRGKWDQSVKPEDMLGPGGPDSSDKGNLNNSDSNKKK